ncbi:MAG: mandelate racemase/muconate lactonizing enzyme family protein [Alphaproteobacteria bacterium]
MSDDTIERVRVYTVGPNPPQFRWARDMKPQYVTLTLIRVTTRGGLEGIGAEMTYSGAGFDRSLAESLRLLVPSLVGARAVDRAAVRARVIHDGGGASHRALGLIDIALWDITGKAAGLPLYRMLGDARDRIPSYASTNTLDDTAAYLDLVAELIEKGFRAIKFHCWCDYAYDRPMVEAVAKRYGGAGVRFMLDTEQRYSRAEAMRMARLLEECDYEWFEAPLPDEDLDGYRELREKTRVPILPAGNMIVDPPLIEHALRLGAWSAVRVSAARAGGISQALKAIALADAHGVPAELQSWGFTLIQATNLHLMLAHPHCNYFEQPYPYEAHDFAADHVIRTDSDGLVRLPDAPGLAIGMDWQAVEAKTLLTFEVS